MELTSMHSAQNVKIYETQQMLRLAQLVTMDLRQALLSIKSARETVI
jgi:hypothetical protein